MKTVAKLLIPKKDFAINVLWFINGPEIGLLDEVINFIAEELPWLVSMGYRISALNWFLLFWIYIYIILPILKYYILRKSSSFMIKYIILILDDYAHLLFFIRKSIWYGTCTYLCYGKNIIVLIFFISDIIFTVLGYWSHYFSYQS